MQDALTTAIKQLAFDQGFHRVGVAAIADWEQAEGDSSGRLGRDRAALQRWLDQGYQADMAWMANPKRADIRQVLPGAQAVIALALNYYSPQQRNEAPGLAKISRYGWGRDYHRVLTGKLKALTLALQAQADELRALAPAGSDLPDTWEFRSYADTGPVQDKLWAQRAGLGWVAKNSNLITRDYGSWVFLGEVITNLPLRADAPHSQHCGTCRRCLEACPTEAIVEPFVVDANRCIAYHTIENRAAELPGAIAPQLQGWVAGCDICQDVCPWNQRFAQPTDVADFEPYPWNVNPSLEELSQLSDADWDQRLPASALRRIKPAMWRRNAQANLQAQAQLNPQVGSSPELPPADFEPPEHPEPPS